MGTTMDMYGMEIYAETRLAQRREEADIRRLLSTARAAAAQHDGSTGRVGARWRRWLRPGTTRPSTPLPKAS
jgi:hypothetical protein